VKVKAGSWLKRAALANAAIAAFSCPAATLAQIAPHPVLIEDGTLAGAIAAIARQTGAEIVSIEPGIGLVPVSRQRLDPAAPRALRQLLRGTGWQAVRVGPTAFRIVVLARRTTNAPAPPNPAPASDNSADGITVIADKFPTRIADYPGSVVRLPAEGGAMPETLTRLTDLSKRAPVVFSTAFGSGRDKLFLRGIADSSFNGASQPTTGIYLDDAPISFGSPNPNLRLYDIASVEVLEGPQGTLYGGGSIGGVIRVTPRPVDLAHAGGWGMAEGSIAASAEPGWKVAAAINLPIVSDRLGLRVVGYDEREGGYIDDPGIGANINQVNIIGTRAALASRLGDGLTLDLGGLYQQTRANDAQYVDGTGPLARSSRLSQPYGSEMTLGRASLRKQWDDGLELASVVAVGHRNSTDRFDATLAGPGAALMAYDIQRSSSMLSNETRLSRTTRSGLSWVIGINLERESDGQSRALGPVASADADPPVLDEVTNVTKSGSLFVQGRVPLAARLEATLGLRYTIARTDSEPARGRIVSFIRGETARHADPTVALLWRATPRVALFARFQTSYRNGGVTGARGVGKVSDFTPDTIVMAETGIRLRPSGSYGLTVTGALSGARWRNIIAELITMRGTPITSNIGDARVLALEGTAEWTHASGLGLGGSFLYSANRISGDLARAGRILAAIERHGPLCRPLGAWTGAAARSQPGRLCRC